MNLLAARFPRSRFFGLAHVIALSALLASCGGGGGGGGGGGAPTVTTNPVSVSFVAFANDQTSEPRSISVTWTGANVAGFAVGTLPSSPTLPAWLQVTGGGQGASAFTVRRLQTLGLVPGAGTYTTTLRVVTGDVNLNPIAQVDIPITLEVIAAPTASPASLSATWVESEQPAARQITVARPDSRATLISATPNVPWLSATVAGDTVTVSGNASTPAVRPGAAAASVRLAFSVGGGTTNVDVPFNGIVNPALGGPAMSVIEFEVNGSTTAGALANRTATVATATQAPVQFNATTNVPWITGGNGMSTGSPNNLVLQLQGLEIQDMEDGDHDGIITITPTTPNISAVNLPVRLKLRLPGVRFVAPVAFTDTLDTDYVVVHGRGLADPNANLRVDGVLVPSANVTVVNDRTIHLVPGSALTAGDHSVTVSNLLGYTSDSGTLRVTAPPTYATASLDAPMASPWGLQNRVVSSPVHRAVFTAICYFCGTGITPSTPGIVHKFSYDAGTAQWTHTPYPYQNLFDVALSPDESTLIVLRQAQLNPPLAELLLVDPATMVTTNTYAVPSFSGGISRQLAVANDGLVFISDSLQAFSLRSRTFVTPGNYELGGAAVASRDGSRVLFAWNNNNVDQQLRYYDSSAGTIATSTTMGRDNLASLSRHATRAFVHSSPMYPQFFLQLLGPNLAVLGTLPEGSYPGELAPDGMRLYAPDFPQFSPPSVRVFDVASAPFTEGTPIAVPGVPNNLPARIAVDPRGGHVFYVSERQFVVLDLP